MNYFINYMDFTGMDNTSSFYRGARYNAKTDETGRCKTPNVKEEMDIDERVV